METLCQPLLRGSRGKIEKRVSDGAIISEQDFVPGSDVRLSIDADLQAAGAATAAACRRARWMTRPASACWSRQKRAYTGGAVVVLDVKTNEVRVLASNPGFDLDELQDHYGCAGGG